MKHKTAQACWVLDAVSVKVSLEAIICVEIGKFMLTNIAVIGWHGFEFASCFPG